VANGGNGPFTALFDEGFFPCLSCHFYQNLYKRITVFGYFVWLVFFCLTFLAFVFLFRGALISIIYIGLL
jgi:hypothetical protein